MTSRSLHRFALLTAAITFLLLGAGGLVTSHGVGMAVPDWPNTFGYNMFFFPVSQWVGGVFYEHTHRLLASGVGMLTTVLALWLYGTRARRFLRGAGVVLLVLAGASKLAVPTRGADALVLGLCGLVGFGASFVWPRCEPAPPWLRRLGVVAFFAVVLQGVLGGLRVVLFKDQIGIFHATLAQLFFVLMCSLALFTSRWWQNCYTQPAVASDSSSSELKSQPRLFWFCAAAAGLILCQLILGATMRHQHAGLSIPDFPTAYGRLWPAMDAQSVARYNQHRLEVVALNPITAFQIALQMVHRLLALGIAIMVALAAWMSRGRLGSRHILSRISLFWVGLILVQASLGAATIWSNKAADVATAHVLFGALSLACGGILCILSFHQSARDLQPELVRQRFDSPAHFANRPSPAVGFE